ncbi:hypothetical protein EDC65_1847 [Stella humosa]|uniref:Uncharacterized protein n=1 Tax=Stella humosa TaxID=94 RepID=A0A3N1M2V1_9PROT|nr:hypothetical protein [Stella humosa]ROQ00052.1 hypothetical protein EDC65_1847 [Stella humosa]BBK30715.1 hypothetical protein STHU_13490 [Stella humosa]
MNATARLGPLKPIDLAKLQALAADMPAQPPAAADFIRSMRDGDRY